MSKKRIYLDHAATTPLDPEVLAVMEPYFTKEFGNPSSIHASGHMAHQALTHARERIADVLHARPQEILCTSGGTESNNLALKGVAEAHNYQGHIVTTAIEHHAVLHTLQYLETRGVAVTYLPVNEQGIVSVDDVLQALRPDTFLVSVMYANNEIGTIQPIAEIGKELQRKNILFHTDAVQAGGVLTLNTKKIHVDMLSLSAHKFYGPKGVGVLYVRNGVELVPQQHGGGQEFKKRASTENVPGIIGCAEALVRAHEHAEKEHARLSTLRDTCIAMIEQKIPDAIITGSRSERLPNNISVCFPDIEGEALVMRLSEKGYDVSSGSACTSGDLEASHVLLALGLERSIALGSIRISMGKTTTQQDIESLVDILVDEVPKCRITHQSVDVACR